MRISIVIPTFRRTEFLAKAFRGLASQTRPADQIVIGMRAGDSETETFLDFAKVPAISSQRAIVNEPGVIASMSAASRLADGDLICLLDDDAEPFPDWLEKIEQHFLREEKLGILGGRDHLQDRPEYRKNEPTTLQVGVFTWYGRTLGNHHRGGGSYRHVKIVKGCNAAIRGPLLREIGFDHHLRGNGAQVHWEMALCCDVTARGYFAGYDPAIQVTHHIAPRYDDDQNHRGTFSQEGLANMVWNEHYVAATRFSLPHRFMHLAWSLLVGQLSDPGLVQYLRLWLRGDKNRNTRLAITYRSIWGGQRKK